MAEQVRTYRVVERPAELGGGFLVVFFQDDAEAGRGVFPLNSEIEPKEQVNEAYAEAVAEGDRWVGATE